MSRYAAALTRAYSPSVHRTVPCSLTVHSRARLHRTRARCFLGEAGHSGIGQWELLMLSQALRLEGPRCPGCRGPRGFSAPEFPRIPEVAGHSPPTLSEQQPEAALGLAFLLSCHPVSPQRRDCTYKGGLAKPPGQGLRRTRLQQRRREERQWPPDPWRQRRRLPLLSFMEDVGGA